MIQLVTEHNECPVLEINVVPYKAGIPTDVGS